MKLKKFYQEIVSKGIEADIRSKQVIVELLQEKVKYRDDTKEVD